MILYFFSIKLGIFVVKQIDKRIILDNALVRTFLLNLFPQFFNEIQGHPVLQIEVLINNIKHSK